MDWKDNLDPILKDFLESLLKEVKKYEDAYKNSDNPARSQIWVALALIYRKLMQLESELNYIKNNVKDEDLEKTLKKL